VSYISIHTHIGIGTTAGSSKRARARFMMMNTYTRVCMNQWLYSRYSLWNILQIL